MNFKDVFTCIPAVEDGGYRVEFIDNEGETQHVIIPLSYEGTSPSENAYSEILLAVGVDRNMVVFDPEKSGSITEDLLILMRKVQKEESGLDLDYFFVPEWAELPANVNNVYKIPTSQYDYMLHYYLDVLEAVLPLSTQTSNLILGITRSNNIFLCPNNSNRSGLGVISNKYVLLGAF